MGTAQIAMIARRLAETYQRSAASGDCCCEMIVTGTEDRWIQVIPTNINMAFPLATEPLTTIERLAIRKLPEMELIEFEPGKFATLQFGEADARTIALFVDRVFVDILGCDSENYSLNIRIFELD